MTRRIWMPASSREERGLAPPARNGNRRERSCAPMLEKHTLWAPPSFAVNASLAVLASWRVISTSPLGPVIFTSTPDGAPSGTSFILNEPFATSCFDIISCKHYTCQKKVRGASSSRAAAHNHKRRDDIDLPLFCQLRDRTASLLPRRAGWRKARGRLQLGRAPCFQACARLRATIGW
jgi:hypothetical protein